MIKTFDKQGNVTKQAQKARFPKFIAYIDGRARADFKLYTKAMTETDLTAAMKTLEKAVKSKKEDVYLCGIYENTGEVNASGEPLYEMIIGARMGEYGLNGWHFWDKEHGETHHGLNRWYSNDFGRDDFEEWDRLGHFEKE